MNFEQKTGMAAHKIRYSSRACQKMQLTLAWEIETVLKTLDDCDDMQNVT